MFTLSPGSFSIDYKIQKNYQFAEDPYFIMKKIVSTYIESQRSKIKRSHVSNYIFLPGLVN